MAFSTQKKKCFLITFLFYNNYLFSSVAVVSAFASSVLATSSTTGSATGTSSTVSTTSASPGTTSSLITISLVSILAPIFSFVLAALPTLSLK